MSKISACEQTQRQPTSGRASFVARVHSHPAGGQEASCAIGSTCPAKTYQYQVLLSAWSDAFHRSGGALRRTTSPINVIFVSSPVHAPRRNSKLKLASMGRLTYPTTGQKPGGVSR